MGQATSVLPSYCSLVILGLMSSGSVFAGIQDAKNWLSNTSSQDSLQALDLQTIDERFRTLSLLQSGGFAQIDIDALLNGEHSTEALVRAATIAHRQQTGFAQVSSYLTQALAHQNPDGGFGHLAGWQSNSLDTAYVLLALSDTQLISQLSSSAEIARWQTATQHALQYLLSQQRSNGSYQVVSLDQLYVSAYVLSALTPYATQYANTVPNIERLVSFLHAAQVAPAQWSQHAQGLFIDALVAEALHPYHQHTDQSLETAFRNRVETLQQQNGSWGHDPYVTAVVLRSLQQQTIATTNPIVSGISLDVVDGETNLPISDAVLSTQANSPVQISGSTHSSGQLVLHDLPAGPYTFSLSRAGFATMTISVTLRQGERLNLGTVRLSRSVNSTVGMIQGRVTDATTGAPLADAQVTVVLVDNQGQPLSGTAPIIVKTSQDGSYQVITTQPSRFGIDIRQAGYISQNGSGQTTAGGVVFFSPRLQSEANFSVSISGQVTDEQNQPLAGAEIRSNGQVLGVTNNLGQFNFSVTTAGQHEWTVEKAGYLTATLNVSLTQSQSFHVGTVRLLTATSNQTQIATGQLVIQGIDPSINQPIDGISVKAELLSANNTILQTQTFSAVGLQGEPLREAKLSLPVGNWKLTISHPAYDSQTTTLTVDANQQKTARINLVSKNYSATGVLIDSQTNQPIKNAPVEAFNNKNNVRVWSGVTDGNGRFSTPTTLNSAELRLEFSPALYLSGNRYIYREIQSESTVDLAQIRLRPKAAEIVQPDLSISKVYTDELTTNQQTLRVQGQLRVDLINQGLADTNASFDIVAFADLNKNRQFDDQDQFFGKAQIGTLLGKSQTQQFTIPIDGLSSFKEAPILLSVDHNSQIAESNEKNNVVATSDGIEIKPPIGTMETTVLWKYPQVSDSGVTVAPLQDSNQDGVIGAGDIASVIVFKGGQYYVINGKTGQYEFSMSGFGSQQLAAIGNVDADALPEIVIPALDGLRIYSNKGVLKKTIPAALTASGWATDSFHPILADLNQDGRAEIMMNDKIFNYDQGLIKNALPSGNSQAVADVDGDGLPEIIGEAGVSRSDGQKLYYFSPLLEFVAVGDVLGSKKPQIVGIEGSQILLFDGATGKRLATYTAPASKGGSPVIADFDGDGIADIGLARTTRYVAMRGDGSIIWSTAIQDSSGGTGSTVFDFDGDGNSEAVHFDERFLRIYDSKTGVERIKIPNSTATAHEYPVVADVDADGHADIVMTSGNSDGVRVISSKNKDWAATRNIWNQYSYHVTNINDDLSIPQFEKNSWEVHNTYRANWLPTNSVAAADLTASLIQIEDNGWFGLSTLKARVGNAGGKRVPAGTPVAFYRIAPAINGVAPAPVLFHVATLSQALEAGDYEDVAISYSGSLADFGELVVIANDAGAGIESLSGIPAGQTNALVIQEYTRANNIARLSIGGGFQSYTLSSNLDQTSYQPNQNVQITAQAANLGSFDAEATIRMTVLDQVGNVLSVLPSQQVTLVAAPDQAATVTGSWNTSNQRIGAYVVRVELIRPSLFGDAEVVATSEQSFSIGSGAAVDTGLTDPRLFADKATYNNVDVINATLQGVSSRNGN